MTDYLGFSALSTFHNIVPGGYSAVGVKNTGSQTGTTTFNQGTVSMPAGVPEPGVWAMLLAGFFGVGYMLRSQRKIQGVAAQA